MSRTITLPTKPVEPSRVSPRLFILYSPPKCGKTTLLSTLKGNCILDFERGTEFVTALSICIIGLSAPGNETQESFDERMASEPKQFYLNEAGKGIMEAKRPYQFITVDTTSVLEQMTTVLATANYKATAMGKNFDGDDVTTLPKGSGYYFTRLAFMDTINRIRKLADNIILVSHVRESILEKEGKEVDHKDLDLVGKVKSILASEADAIGYLHRGKEGELLINFKSSDQLVCGSRCDHLKGKVIKIADYDEEKNELVNINWKLIYPDKNV